MPYTVPVHGINTFLRWSSVMQNPQDVQQAAQALRAKLAHSAPQGHTVAPRTGIVLGTGLGELAEHLGNSIAVPYAEVPSYPLSTVEGHEGRFIYGMLGTVPIILQQGRCHLYEGYSPREVCMGVRIMHEMGVRNLIITNAAGALNPQFDAGGLMLITDHINMTGLSPLTGANHEAWGVRYPDMSAVYDKEYITLALRCAAQEGLRVERGVYLCTAGPQLETPAETRFFRTIGADAVGMSTAMESIAAHHLGMRILGIACLTNKNLPDCMAPATIEDIVQTAQLSSTAMLRLVSALVAELG
jgi:purine-nucleoside phosphorylase